MGVRSGMLHRSMGVVFAPGIRIAKPQVAHGCSSGSTPACVSFVFVRIGFTDQWTLRCPVDAPSSCSPSRLRHLRPCVVCDIGGMPSGREARAARK